MKYDYNANRVYKHLPRMLAWDSVKGIASSVLLLPGRDCLDIKLGLELGKINKDTFLCLYEKEPDVAEIIKVKVKAMGFKNFVVKCFPVQTYITHLKKCNFPKFDLVFLDFCGEITEAISDFIEENFYDKSNLMNPDGVVAFTFSTQLRNNNFFKKYEGCGKFVLPSDTMVWVNSKCHDKAVWICNAALISMNLRSNALQNFITYNDTKTPMVFFVVKSQNDRDKKKAIVKQRNSVAKKTVKAYNGPLSPQQRAWITIRKNKMQKEYDAATSAGIKAAIKRKMNKMAKAV